MGSVPTKDMQTPSQKWSDFYERCGMCWIEWKTKSVVGKKPLYVYIYIDIFTYISEFGYIGGRTLYGYSMAMVTGQLSIIKCVGVV